MRTKNTVFILGAGASVPYGLPSGDKLRADLLNLDPADGKLRKYLRADELSDLQEFRRKYFDAGNSTIDEFLFHNRDFVPLAKNLIAYHLHERQRYFRQFRDSPDGWYHWLFSEMKGNARKPEEIFGVRGGCITFNYDTTLDSYLLKSFCSFFNKSEGFFEKFFRKWGPIHLHGQLGNWPWDGNKRWDFLDESIDSYDEDRFNVLRGASGDLRLWFEGDGSNVILAKALLQQADAIVFLGFGFQEENLVRLFGNRTLSNYFHTFAKEIFGTAKGLEDRLETIRNSFLPENGMVDIMITDCLDFLTKRKTKLV